ncbi:MAG: cache domain-containing protein [Deltaproteobacteria bacterium]|nr:cache domain-containing protein [Deltaproteobacteria bacterium]
MSKIKAVIVVMLLVVLAGGAAFYGLNFFYQKQVTEQASQELASAADLALDHLRVESFEAIQKLIAMTDNADLVSTLATAPTTASLPQDQADKALKPIHDKLLPIATALNTKAKLPKLAILSRDGRILAENPGEAFGGSVQGLPLFKDCLAGVSRDGFYELDGKPVLMAVSPVLGASGKAVGCLMSSAVLDATKLRSAESSSGVHLALFVRKKPLVSTLDAKVLAPLGDLLDSTDVVAFGDPTTKLPLLVQLKGKAFLAKAALLPGGTDPAHLAAVASVGERIEPLLDYQMKVAYGTGALLLLGIFLGLLFSGNKIRKQLTRLHDAVKLAAEGNGASIDADEFKGVCQSLAIDIRRLSDSRARPAYRKSGVESVSAILGDHPAPKAAEAPASAGGGLDFDSLLGSDAQPVPPSAPVQAVPPSTPPLQVPEPLAPPAPVAPAPPPPAPAPAVQPEVSKGPRVDMPGDLASFFEDADSDATREVETVIPREALPPEPPPIAPAPVPPPPLAQPAMAAFDAPDLDDGEDDQITSDDYHPDATVVAQVPDALLKAASTDEEPELLSGPTSLPKPPVMPAPPPPPMGIPSAAQSPDEAHFKEVFDRFVQTKKQCGEPVAGLTYDKFSEKLRKNTSDLKNRYHCNAVKFQVYVKNGKAALKATPVK